MWARLAKSGRACSASSGWWTTAARWDPPFWIGDRLFVQADLDLMRWTREHFASLSRWELAQTICENLPWKAPNGQPRVHECLPLLEASGADRAHRLPSHACACSYPTADSHPMRWEGKDFSSSTLFPSRALVIGQLVPSR